MIQRGIPNRRAIEEGEQVQDRQPWDERKVDLADELAFLFSCKARHDPGSFGNTIIVVFAGAVIVGVGVVGVGGFESFL